MSDTRYPYTHACDYVRGHVTDFNSAIGIQTPTLSRSEASQAIKGIAAALGLTHEALACKLADAFLGKPVATRPPQDERGQGDCGNAECGWRGLIADCSYLGSVGPCCPKCREIVEPDAEPEQPVALSTLTGHGLSREDLEAIADGLDGYERTVNVGNVTGEGDCHLESSTAAAARFIRSTLAASAPEQQALNLCPHGRIQGRRCNDCQDESAQPMTPETEPEVAHGAMCLCQLCVPPFNPAHDGALFLRTINEFMAADAQDAARYRWLREQDWFNGALCVVRDPQKADRLGFDCPSRARLDEFIDNALSGTGSDESKKGKA